MLPIITLCEQRLMHCTFGYRNVQTRRHNVLFDIQMHRDIKIRGCVQTKMRAQLCPRRCQLARVANQTKIIGIDGEG